MPFSHLCVLATKNEKTEGQQLALGLEPNRAYSKITCFDHSLAIVLAIKTLWKTLQIEGGICTTVKVPIGVSPSQIRVPSCPFQFQLPASVYPGRQQGMAQVLTALQSAWVSLDWILASYIQPGSASTVAGARAEYQWLKKFTCLSTSLCFNQILLTRFSHEKTWEASSKFLWKTESLDISYKK